MLLYCLIAALCVTVPLLIASIYYNIKFGIKILDMQDLISEALEVLDIREESMAKILQVPLFHDSAEIRKVHSDIKVCRNSILAIANSLTDTANYETSPGAEDENE